MSRAGQINIRRQALISFTGTLVDAGVSFLGLVAMAYVLGASGLGQYYFLIAVVNTALFPVKGLGQAVLKRGSEGRHSPAQIYGTGLMMVLLYVVLGLAMFGVVAGSDLFTIDFSWNILLATGTLFALKGVLTLQIDAYRSYGHTGYATLVDNVHGILQTGLQLAVLVLGYEIFGLLTATVGATIVTILVHYNMSVVSLSWPEPDAAAQLLTYARWSILSAGVSTIYQRLPVLVLGFVGMDAAVGYYSSANQLLMLGSYVGGSLAPALMAKTSSRKSRSSSQELNDEFYDVHHHVTVLAVGCAFGTFALSGSLMTTFFDMTEPLAATALLGLSLYHVIYPLTNVEYSLLEGLDLPELKTRSTTLGLAVQTLLLVVLLPTFGFVGVIMAFIIGNFVVLLLAQVIFWNQFDMVPFPGGLPTQIASGLIMFGVVEAIQRVVPVTSAVRLILIVGLGAAVYIGALALVDSQFRIVVEASVRDTMRVATQIFFWISQ